MTLLLERPRTRPLVLGPNWFGPVMGTAMVATAATSLPVHLPGLRAVATVIWAIAAGTLVTLTAAWSRHLRGATLRRYAEDPVLSQFFGAPPMALMTVGAGALLLGDLVALDVVLWTLGTVLGLVVAVVVPVLSRHRVDAFGGLLMPVVPPLVSAVTGALLLPHLPAAAQHVMLPACRAMAGLSFAVALLVIWRIWRRLVTHGVGPARLVPTLWIVLGPLGQSVTAAHLLGGRGGFAVLFGVPVLGFALCWLMFAATVTLRTARVGLPFSLAWWSFTFPVGTLVTGAAGLAARTGSPVLAALAVVLYAFLVAAWLVVAIRTVRGVRPLTR
ncbi:TDT family transporter [Micromonosporaceae bacterium Da 78-11]